MNARAHRNSRRHTLPARVDEVMPILTPILRMIVPLIAIAASNGEIAPDGRPPKVTIATSTSMLPMIKSRTASPLWPNCPARPGRGHGRDRDEEDEAERRQ